MTEKTSENPQGNSSKTSENPQKSFNNANWKHYARGQWSAHSQCFFDLKLQGVFDHVQFSVSMMLLNWCYRNFKLGNFEMSRRELAKIANCGDKQADNTIKALIQYSLLEEVYRQKGGHSVYRWNVDNFENYELNLGQSDPSLGSTEPRDLGRIRPGLGSEKPNTNIEYIKLEFLINANRLHAELVDKFNEACTASVPEIINDGNDLPSVAEIVPSWDEAIEVCCRAYGYSRVHLIIKNHAINYFQTPVPRSALAKFCVDRGLIAELRERFPHTRTNAEFSLMASKGMTQLVSLSIKEVRRD